MALIELLRTSIRLLGAVSIALAACDGSDSRPAVDDRPNSAGAAVERSSDAQMTANQSIDWNAVRIASNLESMEVLLHLLRHLDYWHKGRKKVITVQILPAGRSIDGFGNSIAMSLESWKGMVEMLNRSKAATGRPTRFRAAPSVRYSDGLGEVRRYKYSIEADGEDRIMFTCLAPLDR